MKLWIWLLVGLLAWVAWRWRSDRRAAAPSAERAVPGAPPVPPAGGFANGPKATEALQRIPGRRTIMVASVVAALSLATDWVDLWLVHRTGLQLGLSLLLWLWLYPFVAAWRRWRLWPRLASLCLGLSTLSGLLIWYRAAHTRFWFFTVDASGVGIAIYLVATMALWWGLSRYARVHSAPVSGI